MRMILATIVLGSLTSCFMADRDVTQLPIAASIKVAGRMELRGQGPASTLQ